MVMIDWKEEAEKHTFVAFFGEPNTKHHIQDGNNDLCCGKKYARVTLTRMPLNKSEICKICWRNRPWVK